MLTFHFFRVSILYFCFLSSASILGLHYSAFCFFRSVSFRFRLTVAYPVLSFCFRFHCFPPSVRLVSHAFFRFLVLGFPLVSFHPSQLRSHGCSTGAYPSFLPGIHPLHLLSFVRFCFRIRLLSFLPFLFPSSLLPLATVLQVPIYLLSVPPVSMLPFQLWYSAFCSSFHRSTFRLAAATSFLPAFLSV